MTVHSIETVQELIEELQGQGMAVGSAWEYTNTMNNKVMFAVFTSDQFCDIPQAPHAEQPVQIWAEGKFIGKYKHLNSIEALDEA